MQLLTVLLLKSSDSTNLKDDTIKNNNFAVNGKKLMMVFLAKTMFGN